MKYQLTPEDYGILESCSYKIESAVKKELLNIQIIEVYKNKHLK